MKPVIVFCGFVLALALTACSGGAETATVAPTAIAYVAADTSLATPVVGSATVPKVEGIKGVHLYSQPDAKAPLAGEVSPGEAGKVLGTDATGQWVLVQIKDQTGWAPILALNVTIAQ